MVGLKTLLVGAVVVGEVLGGMRRKKIERDGSTLDWVERAQRMRIYEVPADFEPVPAPKTKLEKMVKHTKVQIGGTRKQVSHSAPFPNNVLNAIASTWNSVKRSACNTFSKLTHKATTTAEQINVDITNKLDEYTVLSADLTDYISVIKSDPILMGMLEATEPSGLIKYVTDSIEKMGAKFKEAKKLAEAISEENVEEQVEKIAKDVGTVTTNLKFFVMMMKLAGDVTAPEEDSLEIAKSIEKFTISLGDLIGAILNPKTLHIILPTEGAGETLREKFDAFEIVLKSLKERGLALLTGEGREVAEGDFISAEIVLHWLDEGLDVTERGL